jgi:type IV pilus assembly protein PilV
MKRRGPAAQYGVGLIEVLVTVVVLAIGIIGLSMLHLRNQQAQVEAFQRTQALILAEDMAARILINHDAAGCYSTGTGSIGEGTEQNACSGFGTTETRAVADNDFDSWYRALAGTTEQTDGGAQAGGLLSARGCVVHDDDLQVFTVTVAWQGLSVEVAPSSTCGQGSYGDDRYRRVLTRQVMIPRLFP